MNDNLRRASARFGDYRAVRDAKLPAPAKCILLVLLTYADDAGGAWPSVKTIARGCGFSTTTVRRWVGWLVESDWLRVPEGRRGGREPTRYVLNIKTPPAANGDPPLATGGHATGNGRAPQRLATGTPPASGAEQLNEQLSEQRGGTSRPPQGWDIERMLDEAGGGQ